MNIQIIWAQTLGLIIFFGLKLPIKFFNRWIFEKRQVENMPTRKKKAIYILINQLCLHSKLIKNDFSLKTTAHSLKILVFVNWVSVIPRWVGHIYQMKNNVIGFRARIFGGTSIKYSISEPRKWKTFEIALLNERLNHLHS